MDEFALNEQKRRLGVVVTDQEAESASREYWKAADADAVAAKARDKTRALLDALNRVYDRGGAPKKVYEEFLAPLGVPELEWTACLVSGRTPEGRARLAAPLSVTGAYLTSQSGFMRGTLENYKLEAAVDQEIAAKDDTFRKYLPEWDATPPSPPLWQRQVSMPARHMDYLQAKRAEWWKARHGELHVVLNDPSLAESCRATIAAHGIRLADAGAR